MIKIHLNTVFEKERCFVESIPDKFDSLGELVYDGRNQVRIIMTPNGRKVAVKKFHHPRLIDRIAFIFGKHTKARKAFDKGIILLNNGFDTPCPLAYIHIRKRLFISGFYFISEYTPHPCIRPLIDCRDFKIEYVPRIAAYIAALHNAGILHGDLNSTNILIDKEDNFSLIDTNRSKFRHPSMKEAAANIMRLTTRMDAIRAVTQKYAELRGWNPYIFSRMTIRERLRFERSKRILHSIARKIGIKK